MKRQRAQLAEERRKIEDDIRYKQAHMMSKFEIIQHKDKNLSRDDYYKEIFGTEGNNTSKSNNRSKMSSTMKYEEKEEVDETEAKKEPVTDTNNREDEKYEEEQFNKEEPKVETNEEEENERRFNVEQ